MEKDFEACENINYQERIRRENKLQSQIDERDELYLEPAKTVEGLHLRRAFEKMKLIALSKSLSNARAYDDKERALNKILGFLRGETNTARYEIEEKMSERIQELEASNNDSSDAIRKLDNKNTLLENQIKELDLKIHEVGDKIQSSENRQ